MKKIGKIWMDGRMVGWHDAKVHVLTNGLHYGSGVFEGIRCYETDGGRAIFRLNDHISRFYYSAKCLGIKIPFSPDQIKKSIISLIKINGLRESYIRPVAFCGYDKLGLDISESKINTAIILWPWKPPFDSERGISAAVSSYRRLSPKSVAIDAKISGHYVNSIIASSDSRKSGAQEAVLLDDNGYVAEGPGENIFIIKNGNVYTPSKGSILPGITRDSTIKILKNIGIKVIEKKISVKDLKVADEVFFTGTAVEICPVTKIDSRKIGRGVPGPLSIRIRDEYGRIVRGYDKKYKNWLTHV